MQRSLFLVVCVVFGIAPGALAEGKPITRVEPQQVITDIPSLGEIDQPLISVEGLLVQQPAPTPAPAQVTGVQLKPTEKGLEVILETATEFPEVLTSTTDNNLITDIPNAQLRLPSGGAFRQDNPTQDIVSVEVINLDAKTLRVTVTGKAGVPTAEVSQSPQALILSVAAPPAPVPQPIPAPTAPPATPSAFSSLKPLTTRPRLVSLTRKLATYRANLTPMMALPENMLSKLILLVGLRLVQSSTPCYSALTLQGMKTTIQIVQCLLSLTFPSTYLIQNTTYFLDQIARNYSEVRVTMHSLSQTG